MKMHTYDVLPGYVVYDHNFGLLFKLLYCNLVFSKGLPKGCCGLFMGGLNLGHFVSRFVLGHFLLQTLGVQKTSAVDAKPLCNAMFSQQKPSFSEMLLQTVLKKVFFCMLTLTVKMITML